MAKNITNIRNILKAWTMLLAWVFLIVFSWKYILYDAVPYFGLQETVLGRFWEMKLPLIGHISGGLIALVLGPFQFWTAFRNRHIKIHRGMGMAYISGILIAVISSVTLSLTTALAIHWTYSLSLIALAAAWFATTGMAFRFVMLGRIQLHKEWMIRSYVVTFAFVIFRWLISQPFYSDLGNFLETGPTAIWLTWTVPLFIAEIVLQWNKK